MVICVCFHNFTFHNFAHLWNTFINIDLSIKYISTIIASYSNVFTYVLKQADDVLSIGTSCFRPVCRLLIGWAPCQSHYGLWLAQTISDRREIWENQFFEKHQSWAHVTNHGTPWLPGEHGPQNPLPSSQFLPIMYEGITTFHLKSS